MKSSLWNDDMEGDSVSSSSCSHDAWESDDDEMEHSLVSPTKGRKGLKRKTENDSDGDNAILPRTVLHLDVDCFYCQCESRLDPSLENVPFAVGQKHIIVTCNYVARSFGVKKLMLRTTAKQICSNLIIVEGSDLQHYRRFSRTIYQSFRNSIYSYDSNNNTNIAVKKGGMDEMFADITGILDEKLDTTTRKKQEKNHYHKSSSSFPSTCFVYGNDSSKKNATIISIREDQTGSEMELMTRHYSNFIDGCNLDSQSAARHCVERLQLASHIATDIQNKICKETGFTTCIGISVSPMLAKLASDLKKPKSVNVLFPWRSCDIVKNMPLRRIPELGSKTLKQLLPCLQEYNQHKYELSSSSTTTEFYWTCSDLLSVPRDVIVSTLKEYIGSRERAEERCEFLLSRCKGIDLSIVTDDDGGLTKTVSVEESFVRHSVTSLQMIQSQLKILVQRLLSLLEERRIHSHDIDLAYPTTLRLSVRLVVKKDSMMGPPKRRPFATFSKQRNFDGSILWNPGMKNKNDKIQCLFSKLETLLMELLSEKNNNFNLTKLNVAAVNFQDVLEKEKRLITETSSTKRQKTVKSYFATPFHKKDDTSSYRPYLKEELSPLSKVNDISRIDPDILHELPPDIVSEILKNGVVDFTPNDRKDKTMTRKKSSPKKGIERFFTTNSNTK